MRRSILNLLPVAIVCCLAGRIEAGFEYHFMPGINGQPLGDVQFLDVAPVSGPAGFKVRLSGASVGSNPNADPTTSHAYLDKWGLGVFNPNAAVNKGVQGQVQLDGSSGGEYLRLQFTVPVQLTFLTFSSVGILDSLELLADGNQVDLQTVFPGMSGIRSVALSQNNWPGKIDFTLGSKPLAFAKTWDIRVPSAKFGDGIQLENVGGQQVPEPATLVLWGSAAAGLGLIAWRRRKAAR